MAGSAAGDLADRLECFIGYFICFDWHCLNSADLDISRMLLSCNFAMSQHHLIADHAVSLIVAARMQT